ncbi:hypothetical protein BFP77_09480 [Maribacter sp. 4U21]|nr:hypothetical protein BFP77_09480 [Maribacter sp. 4U21]
MQRLEVGPLRTFYLVYIVDLCDGPVPLPFVRGHLGLPADMVDEDILQRPCREVLDAHGVHAPDLTFRGKLHGRDRLLFLGIVAAPYLSLLDPAEHELVDVHRAVHRVVPAGRHGLPYLEHEQAGGLFGDTVAHAHVTGRQALCTGRHLETDEKGLSKTELDLMEKRVGSGRIGMAADVARPRKVFSYLRCDMVTFDAFETLFPFDPGEILLAVQIRFEAIGEL